jgi:hypothetical protein
MNLTIKDLSASTELDQAAMTAVHGGDATSTQVAGIVNGDMTQVAGGGTLSSTLAVQSNSSRNSVEQYAMNSDDDRFTSIRKSTETLVNVGGIAFGRF